jgi:hypothetical protein
MVVFAKIAVIHLAKKKWSSNSIIEHSVELKSKTFIGELMTNFVDLLSGILYKTYTVVIVISTHIGFLDYIHALICSEYKYEKNLDFGFLVFRNFFSEGVFSIIDC